MRISTNDSMVGRIDLTISNIAVNLQALPNVYVVSSGLTATTKGLNMLLALTPSPRDMGCKQTSLVMFRESQVLRWRWNTHLWLYCTFSGLAGMTKRQDTLLIASPSPAYQAVHEFCGGCGKQSSGCIHILRVEREDKGTGYAADSLAVARVSGGL
jgi:hypothetical protein